MYLLIPLPSMLGKAKYNGEILWIYNGTDDLSGVDNSKTAVTLDSNVFQIGTTIDNVGICNILHAKLGGRKALAGAIPPSSRSKTLARHGFEPMLEFCISRK